MKSAEERKQQSIALLKEQGVPYIEHLPVIETADDVRLRSAEEIARRAICCLITIQLACDLQNQQDVEDSRLFDRFCVRLFLTEKEKAIFNDTATEQDWVNMVWKYEAYWPLIWALGLVDSLAFPDQICDCQKAIEVVSTKATFDEFMKDVQLRPIDDILDEADLIFRYDWACVDARIKGEPAPAGLNSEVVYERHWGLNWLIDVDGQNDWDHVSCNT